MKPRLLVVDDEESILSAIRDYFEPRGYEVDCVSPNAWLTAEAIGRGVDAFLQKPQPLAELAAIAANLIGQDD